MKDLQHLRNAPVPVGDEFHPHHAPGTSTQLQNTAEHLNFEDIFLENESSV